MTPVPTPPTLKLSHLRDIGWTLWDPIGLLRPGQRWDEADALPFADEYDRYLAEAAGMLRRGASDQETVDFLVGIETGHMGLTGGSDAHKRDAHKRAESTVAAMKADSDLWTYPS